MTVRDVDLPFGGDFNIRGCIPLASVLDADPKYLLEDEPPLDVPVAIHLLGHPFDNPPNSLILAGHYSPTIFPVEQHFLNTGQAQPEVVFGQQVAALVLVSPLLKPDTKHNKSQSQQVTDSETRGSRRYKTMLGGSAKPGSSGWPVWSARLSGSPLQQPPMGAGSNRPRQTPTPSCRTARGRASPAPGSSCGPRRCSRPPICSSWGPSAAARGSPRPCTSSSAASSARGSATTAKASGCSGTRTQQLEFEYYLQQQAEYQLAATFLQEIAPTKTLNIGKQSNMSGSISMDLLAPAPPDDGDEGGEHNDASPHARDQHVVEALHNGRGLVETLPLAQRVAGVAAAVGGDVEALVVGRDLGVAGVDVGDEQPLLGVVREPDLDRLRGVLDGVRALEVQEPRRRLHGAHLRGVRGPLAGLEDLAGSAALDGEDDPLDVDLLAGVLERVDPLVVEDLAKAHAYLHEVGLVGVAAVLAPEPLEVDRADVAAARRTPEHRVDLPEGVGRLPEGVHVAAGRLVVPQRAAHLLDRAWLRFVRERRARLQVVHHDERAVAGHAVQHRQQQQKPHQSHQRYWTNNTLINFSILAVIQEEMAL